jgi:uncharacterized protein YciI
MAYFVVIDANGPNWDPTRARREQAGWDEHAAFMDDLTADGFVVLGGPVGDVNGERAMLVVEAGDRREVETRLAGDPWHADGMLVVDSIEPWTIWLDGR